MAVAVAHDMGVEDDIDISVDDITFSQQQAPEVQSQDDDSTDFYDRAADLKETGNAFFKQKRWQDAIMSYEAAIESILITEKCSAGEGKELLVALHANLAQCHLNLEDYRRAIASASVCLKLDSTNQKALFRRAVAHEHLGEAEQALVDLDAILKIDPTHDQAKTAHTQLIVRQAGAAADGAISTWFLELNMRDRYEWFVDCYRLRLHEDCATESSSRDLRGLYIPDAKRDTVLEDWLVFCRLAAICNALPKDWSWQGCLEVASQPLCSFWGADEADRNASASKLQLMREVANRIYEDTARHHSAQQAVTSRLRATDHSIFDDLGGAAIWHRFLRRLPDPAEVREAAELADFEKGF